MKKRLVLVVLLLIVLSAALYSDEREEPIDIIIALDKSLSMVEEIEAVQEYVNTYIIDELLIPGDFFLVVAFYGKTEIPLSMKISGNADKERAKQIISSFLADGRFTDIGNALDVLGSQLEKFSGSERKKFLMLITDGIQEAPPESKYYSPDGSFNHEFLKNTKTIQKKGWKIEILGIGTYQAAEELARELSGKYVKISEKPTSKEIAEKTKDFLSTLELTEQVKFSGINNRGEGILDLVVESKGYTEDKTIEISEILFSIPGQSISDENILTQTISITMKPDTIQEESLPVKLPSHLESGDYSGSIQFFFSSSDHFIPVVMKVEFHVKSFFENYWIWLLVGIILLAALIVLLIKVIPVLIKAKLRFQLIVRGQTRKKEPEIYTLREGKPLFLEESENIITINPSRSTKSIARLMFFQKGMRMILLKSDRFPKLRDVPRDVLGFSFDVRTESRKVISVEFEKIS